MSRVVFQLIGNSMGGAERGVSISLEEPADFEALDQPFQLASDTFAAAVLPGDNRLVKRQGLALFEAIQAHPRVSAHLGAALSSTDERYPVYVEIGPGSGVESFPWEALCTPDGTYLALDKKIALARLVRSRAPEVPFHELAAPIKIAAVLSCQGATAAQELAAIRTAATSAARQLAGGVAAGDGLVKILLLSGEEELIVQALADMNDGKAPELEAAELIPGTVSELAARIAAFQPHILHFFCHGSATPTPRLQIALKDDFVPGAQGSGLKVESSQLHEFRDISKISDRPWLVVLNCCEGGAADPMSDARSLALDLTYDGVAAAVIGMREPVTPIVATVLTAKMYAALLGELARHLSDPMAGVAPLDWARLAVGARNALATDLYPDRTLSEAAATTKEWTLPVVYLRPQQFWLKASAPPAGLAADAPMTPDGGNFEARTKRLEFTALLRTLGAMQEEQGAEFIARAMARLSELSKELGVDLPPETFGVEP
jgi:hypothetical protein